jgi:2-keto-4-pentenoate hydratase/2-oxohepta-3-ene-1,7-dioic acid hydratase in catechol pathway
MEKYQLGTIRSQSKGESVVAIYKERTIDLLAMMKENYSIQGESPRTLLEIIEQWDTWREKIPNLLDQIPENDQRFLIDIQGSEWLPPISNPRKLICVGANYKDHIEEMGKEINLLRPYTFLKPVTTLTGTGAIVKIPPEAHMVDWEAELGVIIGKRIRDAKGQVAMDAIAGYTIMNDISARDWVAERSAIGMDWVIQKGYDGFHPTGPVITPAAFVPDPQNLNISLSVNGLTKQNSNTSKMVFSVRQIIEHLSSIMTLEPGDLIATGTPAGVAHGKNNFEYLERYDVVTVEIEGLGKLVTTMV